MYTGRAIGCCQNRKLATGFGQEEQFQRSLTLKIYIMSIVLRRLGKKVELIN